MHNKPHSEETKRLISAKAKGRRVSEETKQKISAAGRGKVFSAEHRHKISLGRRGMVFSPEHRANLSNALKGRKRTEEERVAMGGHKPSATCFTKGHVPWNSGRKASEDSRLAGMAQKIAETRRGKPFPNWGGVDREATREKLREARARRPRGQPMSAEHKAKIAASMRRVVKGKQWRDNLAAALVNRPHSAERVRSIVAGVTASRKRPRRMSQPEVRVASVLDSMYGVQANPYKFTGHGVLWIELSNGRVRNPDFTASSNRKLIEVFGRYWHRKDNPTNIIAQYKLAGWDCLILWDDETGPEMIDRVQSFTYPAEYWYEFYEANKVA